MSFYTFLVVLLDSPGGEFNSYKSKQGRRQDFEKGGY